MAGKEDFHFLHMAGNHAPVGNSNMASCVNTEAEIPSRRKICFLNSLGTPVKQMYGATHITDTQKKGGRSVTKNA
jgi:hypothetical protein